MRRSINLIFVLVALFACVASISAQLCFNNGSATPVNATRVLAQPNFTTDANTEVARPIGIAISPTGKLVVSSQDQTTSGKMLVRFANSASMMTGENPDATFITIADDPAACNSSNLYTSGSLLHISANDSLYVSDAQGNRIVVLENVSSSSQAALNGGFTRSYGVASPAQACPTDDALINSPTGLVLDETNNYLYVASIAPEALNGGVYRFSNSFIPDGRVVNTLNAGCTANGLGGAYGIAIDNAGNLWVTDINNARVLNFGNVTGAPLNVSVNATSVLGQPDLVTCGPTSVTQSTLVAPYFLTFDEAGDLYVTDASIPRTMIWTKDTLNMNGSLAAFQLGQQNFNTSDSGDVSAHTLYAPTTAYDRVNNQIIAPDYLYNRVLAFCKEPENVTSSETFTTGAAETTGAFTTGAFTTGAFTTGAFTTGAFTTGAGVTTGAATNATASEVIVTASDVVNATATTAAFTTGAAATATTAATGTTGAAATTAAGTSAAAKSSAAASAKVTPSTITKCGDSLRGPYEQCDPPNALTCCAATCMFADIDQVCRQASGPCFKDAKCAYLNPTLRTGRSCTGGEQKKLGARCSDYNPLMRCTATGACVLTS